MWASFKAFVSKKAKIWGVKEYQSNDKLLSKIISFSYQWNKKHSSKQVASITYTLENIFFHLLLLKLCESFPFEQSNKSWSVLWSVWVFFALIEQKQSNKYYLREVNLMSHRKIFILMCPSLNLVWKIAVWNIGYVFAYFYGGHKHNFPLWFRSSFKVSFVISSIQSKLEQTSKEQIIICSR